MNLVRQQLPPRQLADFRARGQLQAKYHVAARLWAQHNIAWNEAMEIADSAFGDLMMIGVQK